MPTLLLAALLAPQLPAPPDAATSTAAPASAPEPAPEIAALSEGATPLNEAGTVLLDRKRKRVVVKANVALRSGSLEMLMCLPQTKEHESILSYEGDARTLHAALIAAGLEPGEPVSFDPDFTPPKGPVVGITLHWTDEAGVARSAPARQWIRTSTDRWYERDLAALPKGMTLPEDLELRYAEEAGDLLWYGRMTEDARDRALALSTDATYRKHIQSIFKESQPQPMKADFVFAGSFFYDKPIKYNSEGEVLETVRTYAAEGGEVVCVANFPSALIDIAEQSSADGQGVLYEAATEQIPPKDTPVIVTFTQQAGNAAAGDGAPGDAGADSAGPAGEANPGE